jgi:hypothetical protein
MLLFFCSREKAKEIVKKRGGSVTEDEEEATHIIHPRVELNTELYARYTVTEDKGGGHSHHPSQGGAQH